MKYLLILQHFCSIYYYSKYIIPKTYIIPNSELIHILFQVSDSNIYQFISEIETNRQVQCNSVFRSVTQFIPMKDYKARYIHLQFRTVIIYDDL